MATQTLTLRLPESVWQHLREVADATHQPLEQIARQSIEGNLPPSVANAPPELQGELLAMQALPVTELQQLALSQAPHPQQLRHLALLEKNSQAPLPAEEQSELVELRVMADRLMLTKAYAWAVLRWLGHPIPTLEELPLP